MTVAPVTAHRLRSRLARVQAGGRLPSVVAGVVRDGELVWTDGIGDVPADPADVQYRIGSITKTLTAVLILRRVAAGSLSLDDPIGSVLGEVGYADRTVRSLLVHDSGMQAEPEGSWWERSEGVSFDELTAANDGSRAVPTGGRFHYSNLGYALLGEAAARLAGETWWACMRDEILAPLGMLRTTFLPEAPAAQGYSVHPHTGELLPEPHTDTGAMAPAGQLWSTVGDLARWASFLLDGQPDVLERESLRVAFLPRAGAVETGLDAAHALGFQLVRGGSGTLAGHSGSMPGFLAACFVDVRRRTAAIAFGNAMTGMVPPALAAELLGELEASEPTIPEPWRPTMSVPESVRELLGVWHWGPTPYVFEWASDELVVRRGDEVAYRYRLAGDRLVGTEGYQLGETLEVVRDDDGAINHLNLATFVFTRTPYDPNAPIPGGAP